MNARTLGLLLLAACTSNNDSGKAAGASTAAGVATSHFFMPTGDPTNTSAPSIEVDAQGGIHSVYPNYVRGGAFYAYCPASCSGTDQVKIVHFDTDGTVANAMLALDAQGVPHVLLSSATAVYYATPNGDVTNQASWTNSEILRHNGEREVTGEAFALDPQGRPRFLMHTYKAYLGIGQKAPEAYFVSCDGSCNTKESWTASKIADQMMRSSAVRIDANGVVKVATAATLDADENSSGTVKVTYLECAADCGKEDSWHGIALMPAYESDFEAVTVHPAVSLALTKTGAPRIAFLGANDSGKKQLMYFECDAGCTGDVWRGTVLSDNSELDAGVDIALDANDHPRIAFTQSYDIGLVACDGPDCTMANGPWSSVMVESGSTMKPDEIFLYDNCTVGAWFLHSPSIALTADGAPRVGYQARDISGGFGNSDPTRLADCRAGTDMTWSRMTIMAK